MCTAADQLNLVSPPTSSKQVEVRVSPQNPEAIMVPSESLHSRPFGHIPHPDALVLRVRQDEFLPRVEDGTGNIVVMTATCVELPCFGFWTVGRKQGGNEVKSISSDIYVFK